MSRCAQLNGSKTLRHELKAAAKSAEARATLAAQPELYPGHIIAELGAPPPAAKADKAERMLALLALCHMLRFRTVSGAIKPPRDGAPPTPSSEEGTREFDHHPAARERRIPRLAWEHLLAEYTEAERPREGQVRRRTPAAPPSHRPSYRHSLPTAPHTAPRTAPHTAHPTAPNAAPHTAPEPWMRH